MSFSVRRIGIVAMFLLSLAAFLALGVAGSDRDVTGADGPAPAPTVTQSPIPSTDGWTWG